jgi:hypothetical protein
MKGTMTGRVAALFSFDKMADGGLFCYQLQIPDASSMV